MARFRGQKGKRRKGEKENDNFSFVRENGETGGREIGPLVHPASISPDPAGKRVTGLLPRHRMGGLRLQRSSGGPQPPLLGNLEGLTGNGYGAGAG